MPGEPSAHEGGLNLSPGRPQTQFSSDVRYFFCQQSALTLKVKTAVGNLYITRFLDNGSGKKRSYGHKDFTAPTLEVILSLMRAWVRPVHGEIWIGRRDGHPSQRAKSFQDALSDAQIHDESTAPYQHESMPVWIRRRAEVLTEAFDMGECDPRKIEEYNNFSDPETKYLVYRVWMRHLHYTHNLDGEPPPPVVKPSKKGPTTAKVLTTKEKADFLLLVGL